MKRTFAKQGRPWHFVPVSFSGGGGGGQGAVGAVQGLIVRVCAREVPVGAWRMASPTIAQLNRFLVCHARALTLRGRTNYGARLAGWIFIAQVDRMRSKRGRGSTKAAEKKHNIASKASKEGRKGLVFPGGMPRLG